MGQSNKGFVQRVQHDTMRIGVLLDLGRAGEAAALAEGLHRRASILLAREAAEGCDIDKLPPRPTERMIALAAALRHAAALAQEVDREDGLDPDEGISAFIDDVASHYQQGVIGLVGIE